MTPIPDDVAAAIVAAGHSLQATAEGAPYDEEGMLRLLRLARIGCDRIFAAQEAAVRGA